MASIWENLKNSIKPIKTKKRSAEEIDRQRADVASTFSGENKEKFAADLAERRRRKRLKEKRNKGQPTVTYSKRSDIKPSE